MRKNIIFNITKHVRVEESPFSIVIYIYKDRNTILVEDMITGKCVQASSYDISKYLKLNNIQTEWKRSFNHSYTRMQNSTVEYFMPLYMEANRFANLTFDIINCMKPDFRTKRVPDPSDTSKRGREVNIVNNEEEEPDRSGGTGTPLKTYKELYENVKDFETDNFKLEMIEYEREKVYDENFKLIKSPHITCRLPMFQIYTLLIPNISDGYERMSNVSSIRFGYRQELTVIKIKDSFYRFPYGNISSNDSICLGNNSYTVTKKQPDSIQDAAYARMITSVFNGDYVPNIKFNNQVPSCFDIDVLREKVKNDDFTFSFMDALFYLSQCESIDDINLDMFIRTPSIPKAISDFERKLLNKPQDEDDDQLCLPEETTDPNDAVPMRRPDAGFERGNLPEFVAPVEEIQVRDELRDPTELQPRYNPESHGHASTTSTMYVANEHFSTNFAVRGEPYERHELIRGDVPQPHEVRLRDRDELRERLAQVGITEFPGGTLDILTGEELQYRAEQFANPNHNDLPGLHEYAVRFVGQSPIESIPLNVTISGSDVVVSRTNNVHAEQEYVELRERAINQEYVDAYIREQIRAGTQLSDGEIREFTMCNHSELPKLIRTDVPQTDITVNNSYGTSIEENRVQDGQHFDGEGRLVASVEELHEQALDQQFQAELPQDTIICDPNRRTIEIDLTEVLASPINNTEGEENDTNRESTDTN